MIFRNFEPKGDLLSSNSGQQLNLFNRRQNEQKVLDRRYLGVIFCVLADFSRRSG